jgi:hypothetical protein
LHHIKLDVALVYSNIRSVSFKTIEQFDDIVSSNNLGGNIISSFVVTVVFGTVCIEMEGISYQLCL